jgi:hypothetical protein
VPVTAAVGFDFRLQYGQKMPILALGGRIRRLNACLVDTIRTCHFAVLKLGIVTGRSRAARHGAEGANLGVGKPVLTRVHRRYVQKLKR